MTADLVPPSSALRERIATISRSAVGPLLADLADRLDVLEFLILHDVYHESHEWCSTVNRYNPAGSAKPETNPTAAATAVPAEDLAGYDSWALAALTLLDRRSRPSADGSDVGRERRAVRELLNVAQTLGKAETISPGIVGRLVAARNARGGAA